MEQPQKHPTKAPQNSKVNTTFEVPSQSPSLSSLATTSVPQKLESDLVDSLVLADPNYFLPSGVEIILGVDAIPYIQKPISIIRDGIVLQDSHFGFLISGTLNPKNKVVPKSISNASLSVSVMNFTFTKGSYPTHQAFLEQKKVMVQGHSKGSTRKPINPCITGHKRKIKAKMQLIKDPSNSKATPTTFSENNYLSPSHLPIGRKTVAPIKFQVKRKWKSQNSNLNVGALVIIKNELLPPSRWQIARVEEILPGRDGLVRVVALKTPYGTI
jgi:hypothetical protein